MEHEHPDFPRFSFEQLIYVKKMREITIEALAAGMETLTLPSGDTLLTREVVTGTDTAMRNLVVRLAGMGLTGAARFALLEDVDEVD